MIAILIAALWALGAQATPVYQVQQVDPSFDVGKMAAPDVKVHKVKKSTLPSVEVRDKLIQQAGLAHETSSWDELDKDLLYIRARHAGSSDALKDKYPGIPPEKLGKLVRLVKSSKATTASD